MTQPATGTAGWSVLRGPGRVVPKTAPRARTCFRRLSKPPQTVIRFQRATSTALLLLVAGHETTVSLVGNGMPALLRHPDQFAALRAEMSLVPNAVEEFRRFDGPVNVASLRYTTEPVGLGGVTIPAGELVLVSLVSTNRDRERFARPDEPDVTRDTSGHVAFGYGIHHCLGAPLVRLEGEIAFRTLIERFPQLTLAEEPQRLAWWQSTRRDTAPGALVILSR